MSLPLRPLGNTGLLVTPITLGGSPLGSMPGLYGVDTNERTAIETVHAAFDAGIRTIDTSNGYSDGESERRIGKALKEYGTLPENTLVITKVDPRAGDYSGARVLRSLEESASNLGIQPLPVVHLHDPEFWDFDYMTKPDGAVAQLVKAQDDGLVGHIGLAGGDTRVGAKYWEIGVFDLLLVHNRYTLVDRSAESLLARAESEGAGLINAAVLGGGLLTDPQRSTKYCYAEALPEVAAAAEAMRQVCRRYGTDLGTAATVFSTSNPRFATTLIGMSKPERVAAAIAAVNTELPDELWEELEALVPAERFWVDRR